MTPFKPNLGYIFIAHNHIIIIITGVCVYKGCHSLYRSYLSRGERGRGGEGGGGLTRCEAMEMGNRKGSPFTPLNEMTNESFSQNCWQR